MHPLKDRQGGRRKSANGNRRLVPKLETVFCSGWRGAMEERTSAAEGAAVVSSEGPVWQNCKIARVG